MKDSLRDLYANKIRVRVCGVLIRDNQLLLIHHRGVGEENELWSPPGGGLEFGECAQSCLKREFLEETGLKVEVDSFLFTNEYLSNQLHAIELFFSVKEVGGELCIGHDPELNMNDQIIVQVKFVTISELMIIKAERKHNILKELSEINELLNMSGYFKFCQ